MLLSLLLISLVIAASVNVGSLLLRAGRFSADTEDFFHAFWVGLCALLIGSTLAVCLGPVAGWGIPALAAVFGVSLLSKTVRRVWASLARHAGRWGILCAGVILLVLSLAAAGLNTDSDTGFYHYQIIRWYADYGAVPGVALLHSRLGFHSALFSLTAMLEGGPLRWRSGEIVNAAAFCVGVWWSLWILFPRRLHPQDRFSLFLPAALLLGIGSTGASLISTSPDVLLVQLTIAFFFIACQWWHSPAHPSVSLLLLIAAAGFAVKSSGALLVVAAFSIAVTVHRRSLTGVLRAGVVTLLLITPVCAVQIITSGHPLYPVVAWKAPVSWALPDQGVLESRRIIRQFPVYGYEPAPAPLGFRDVARRLAKAGAPNLYGVIALNLWALYRILRSRLKTFETFLALGLCGGGLLQLGQVPSAKFALGMLTIAPALAIARLTRSWLAGTLAASLLVLALAPWPSNRLDVARLIVYLAALILAAPIQGRMGKHFSRALLALLFVFQFMRPWAHAGATAARMPRNPLALVLPDRLAAVEFRTVQTGNVMVRQPLDRYNCNAIEPPCAPFDYQANFLTLNGLKYRCADRRLACGFGKLAP